VLRRHQAFALAPVGNVEEAACGAWFGAYYIKSWGAVYTHSLGTNNDEARRQ